MSQLFAAWLCLLVLLSPAADMPAAEATLPKLEPLAPGAPFTFAVIGDYRGDSDGNMPPVLLEMFAMLNRDAPKFVLSSGDLINGYPEEDEPHLRKLWGGYLAALKTLQPPIFHVPGNHDIFHALSARLYAEMLGPTHYAFDYAGVRFICLDTETDPSRVDETQFGWLRAQIEAAGERRLFIMLHQPPFPVDGHIAHSLDIFPEDRDRLHRLFMAHREQIGGVFLGHEHLFEFEHRDGVPYLISAGGGAPLYVPEELGGYYHYLLVHVSPNGCEFELRKPWNPEPPPQPSRVIRPGDLLEDWTQRVLWNFWDQSLTHARVSEPVKSGRGALKMTFNLARYEYPSVATSFHPPRDFSKIERVKFDLFVPESAPDGLTVKAGFEAEKMSDSAPVALHTGWNAIDLDLAGDWLPPKTRAAARRLQITFGGPATDAMRSVVLDNLRSVPAGSLAESWEGALEWASWDESTAPTIDENGRLQLDLDFAAYKRPRLYAQLRPHWDLAAVETLALELFVPDHAPKNLAVHLALTGSLETCVSPGILLQSGLNAISVPLEFATASVRHDARTVEWWFASEDPAAKTRVSFGQFTSGEKKK